MSSPDFHTLLIVLILAVGAAIFLRLVGKEKYRREKWLQFRLDEKIKELRQASTQAHSTIVEANPVDDELLLEPE